MAVNSWIALKWPPNFPPSHVSLSLHTPCREKERASMVIQPTTAVLVAACPPVHIYKNREPLFQITDLHSRLQHLIVGGALTKGDLVSLHVLATYLIARSSSCRYIQCTMFGSLSHKSLASQPQVLSLDNTCPTSPKALRYCPMYQRYWSALGLIRVLCLRLLCKIRGSTS